MLKAMARRVTRKQTETLLAKLRRRVPGVAIRTTLIAGFPGETEAEFEELLAFVKDFGFDALGVFPYSLEPDTPSGRMKGQLPDAVKQERTDALMAAQQKVAFAKAAKMVRRTLEALIESAPDRSGVCRARHAGQAPEVDSLTLVTNAKGLAPGALVRVRVHGRQDFDLLARPADVTLKVLAR